MNNFRLNDLWNQIQSELYEMDNNLNKQIEVNNYNEAEINRLSNTYKGLEENIEELNEQIQDLESKIEDLEAENLELLNQIENLKICGQQ